MTQGWRVAAPQVADPVDAYRRRSAAGFDRDHKRGVAALIHPKNSTEVAHRRRAAADLDTSNDAHVFAHQHHGPCGKSQRIRADRKVEVRFVLVSSVLNGPLSSETKILNEAMPEPLAPSVPDQLTVNVVEFS